MNIQEIETDTLCESIRDLWQTGKTSPDYNATLHRGRVVAAVQVLWPSCPLVLIEMAADEIQQQEGL